MKPFTPAPKEQLNGLVLRFKWTISHGRDTDGYNICTLRDGSGTKLARCNGGGYDMRGTCFGDWIEGQFQPELVALIKAQQLEPYGQCDGVSCTKKFYGAVLHQKPGKPDRVSLDGACGFESMQTILKALGWQVRFVTETTKESIWRVEPAKASQ